MFLDQNVFDAGDLNNTLAHLEKSEFEFHLTNENYLLRNSSSHYAFFAEDSVQLRDFLNSIHLFPMTRESDEDELSVEKFKSAWTRCEGSVTVYLLAPKELAIKVSLMESFKLFVRDFPEYKTKPFEAWKILYFFMDLEYRKKEQFTGVASKC